MKGITFIAKTKKGEKALRKAIEDNRNAPFLQRQTYKALYKQSILKQEPFTLRLEHRQKQMEEIIPPSSILPPVKLALQENGAKMDVDWTVVLDD